MAGPFLFISRTALKEGKQDAYERMWQRTSDLVEREEPRLFHFGLYISEDGGHEATFQVHPDADSMVHHMSLVRDHVQNARDFIDFSTMEIQIFGTPNEAVLEQMRQLAGAGVPIRINRPVAGFSRLEDPAAVTT